MNSSPSQWEAQIQSLTEANETMLRSKSKLQQDLLTLKKDLAAKDQQIEAQAKIIDQQTARLADKEQLITELKTANEEQKEQLLKLEKQNNQLADENRLLKKRSWFQRLFGTK